MALSFYPRELPPADAVPVLSLTVSELQDLADELHHAAREMAIAASTAQTAGLRAVHVAADAIDEPLLTTMTLRGLAADIMAAAKTGTHPRDCARRANVVSGVRLELGADASIADVLAVVRQLDELARDDETDQDQDDGALILVDDGE